MTLLSWALLVGGLLGGSVWLLVIAVSPPRVDLAAAAGRWERRRDRYPTAAEAASADGRPERLGRSWTLGQWLVRQVVHRGWQLTSLRANLALLDRTLESHLVTKVAMAVAGLLLPSFTSAVLLAVGIHVPLLGSLLVGLVLAAAFFVVPDYSVRELAADRRTDLRRALSCYLDLVAMSLAGGRGVPEALPTAAEVGQGWGFALLARTVATARSTGVTPWVALGELGQSTGISELQDLGSALSLVAHDGARVRESLSARASTQRRRALAEAEGDAKKANQSMTMAQIVLALGFLVFLGYPAMVNVLAL